MNGKERLPKTRRIEQPCETCPRPLTSTAEQLSVEEGLCRRTVSVFSLGLVHPRTATEKFEGFHVSVAIRRACADKHEISRGYSTGRDAGFEGVHLLNLTQR